MRIWIAINALLLGSLLSGCMNDGNSSERKRVAKDNSGQESELETVETQEDETGEVELFIDPRQPNLFDCEANLSGHSSASLGKSRLQVEGIKDGDTFSGIDENGTLIKIRMFGIDAPESDQTFGPEASQELEKLIANTVVDVVFRDTSYDRQVAEVFLNGKDISLAMVRAGMAWHYSAYAFNQLIEKCESYQRAQSKAFNERSGLWQQSNPLAPWDFRSKR